ncbi:hypothetical protein EVAR_20447_1 [Eumeta japonica]|uniref:Uncharacterized protein n=1 Tax=Eumeta variegata TaxID=151549 RepID=A0A4C1TXZ0_EUMVA|nr:hypothetical protein EVAR_20447_1 [Eumeta japonica]
MRIRNAENCDTNCCDAISCGEASPRVTIPSTTVIPTERILKTSLFGMPLKDGCGNSDAGERCASTEEVITRVETGMSKLRFFGVPSAADMHPVRTEKWDVPPKTRHLAKTLNHTLETPYFIVPNES